MKANAMRLIIPRECPSPLTTHCVGPLPEPPETGATRCDFCGRFMPLDEAINFDEGN